MAPRGRPTKFTKALARQICDRLAEGESLRSICKDDGMPNERTVRSWAIDDIEGFSPHYARARDLGLDAMADEALEICDNATNDWMVRRGEDDAGWVANGDHIARSRLRVDTRKWYLSKLAPKRYGDKLELRGDADNPLQGRLVIEREIVKGPNQDT